LTTSTPAAPAAASPDTTQTQEAPAAKAPDTSQNPASEAQPAASSPDNTTAPAASGDTAAAADAPSQPTPTSEKAEAPPQTRPHKAVAKLAPAHAAIAASVEKPAAASAPDADLEAAGERYLYGNGAAQNCIHAESNLRTAATHGNSKAQTVLGTMYATGHCVGKDLPTAYRWFARALHADPQNSRISADLQVLWRQMTPQEKQLATTSKP
jgi:TPR repeat protein